MKTMAEFARNENERSWALCVQLGLIRVDLIGGAE